MITLLTDFGISDFYVGSMKGVILTINPDIQIVDISHAVSPQNIEEGAFILKQVYHYFPQGTIHVVVIDPGVGSARRIIVLDTQEYIFLAPDNGVLKYIFDDYTDYRVIEVNNSMYYLNNVSTTFHGRDIFAPIAAHLSLGVDIADLGEEISNYIKPEIIKPVKKGNKITGQVMYIDSFGNCITNISSELLESKKEIQIQIKNLVLWEIKSNYSEVSKGEVLALFGSSGMLEISVNEGNAQEQYAFRVGDRVVVEGARKKAKDKRQKTKDKRLKKKD
ncbi:MAG: SAM-dependent chlorinase/fluorinase [bacterium]